MNLLAALNRLVRYCAVGLIAAAIHAAVLLSLGSWLPLSLANPIGFLTASVAGELQQFQALTKVRLLPLPDLRNRLIRIAVVD